MAENTTADLHGIDPKKFTELCELTAGLSGRVKELQDRYSGVDRAVGDFKEDSGEINKRLDDIQKVQKELQDVVATRNLDAGEDAHSEDKVRDEHMQILRDHAPALAAFRLQGQTRFDEAVNTIVDTFGLDRAVTDSILNSRIKGHGRYPARYQNINRSLSDLNRREIELSNSMQRAMDTATSGEGADWVTAMWSTDLIQTFRQTNTVVSNLRSIDMPRGTMRWPKMGSDPTVYYIAENTADSGTKIGASTPGTAYQELAAKKLGARWLSSYEFEADSIIAISPVLRQQGIDAMNNAVAYVLVRGDEATGASANINKNDGTPTTTAGAASYYLVTDGIHKYCIDGVSNGGNTLTGATYDVATLTFAAGSDDLVAMRALMTGGIGNDTPNLMVLANNAGYIKMLDAAGGVKTLEQFGPGAVLLTGQLASVQGIPVVVEGQIPNTENGQTGEIVSSPSTTKGNITLIHRPSFIVGFAPLKNNNRVLIETESDIETQQDIVVLSIRLDIMPLRDVAAVLGYDID